MIDILRDLGLPISISSNGAAIDETIALMHWLMLILFIGWGTFFIVSLVKFRKSKSPQADYIGVKSHISTVFEVAVALIEIVLLIGFSFPIWASRVNDVPNSNEGAVHIRVVAQQYAWNIHYPGPDGIFGSSKPKLVDEVDNPIGLDRSSPGADDDFYTINQLHIPVKKKIRIDLTTKDVIHSFKLPELRVGQDAIPGMRIPVHFEATMTSDQFDSLANSKLINNEPYRGGEPFTDLIIKNGIYDEWDNFTDVNENGIYDEGEPFTDLIIKNGIYDEWDNFTDLIIKNWLYDEWDNFTDLIIKNGIYDEWDNFTDEKNGIYDEGEEFTDVNENGIYDEGEEFTDALNGVYDEGEEFTDALNGVYDEGEEFTDEKNGIWDRSKGLEISCAQLCGLGHYRMKGYLTVDTEEEYDDWLNLQAAYLLEENEEDW